MGVRWDESETLKMNLDRAGSGWIDSVIDVKNENMDKDETKDMRVGLDERELGREGAWVRGSLDENETESEIKT